MARRYKRFETPDFSADLWPGDPGYRLRPGTSGLDPLETYQEQARMMGLVMLALATGRFGSLGRPLAIALGGSLLMLVAYAADWPLEIADKVFIILDRGYLDDYMLASLAFVPACFVVAIVCHAVVKSVRAVLHGRRWVASQLRRRPRD